VLIGKRGPKPRIISTQWSPDLAYAVGPIATDGYLSSPSHGHLIDLTSKDPEQLTNFSKCIGLKLKHGKKSSGFSQKQYWRVQFKSVLFHNFLTSIGLSQAKSTTLGDVSVPQEYFFDFLRGVFDGDGYSHSYWDLRWRSSFMYYVCFSSSSRLFLDWLRMSINTHLGVNGHMTFTKKGGHCYQLKYAKREGLQILRRMYMREKSGQEVTCLSRKHLKVRKMLAIVGERL